MIKNLLKLSLLVSSASLVGCGAEDGNDNYAFVTPSQTPVEMDSATKTVTIDVDGLNGDEVVSINLLDGITVNSQALTNDTTEVFIKGLADPTFVVNTVPAPAANSAGTEVLYFEYDAVNEENAANAGSSEQLENVLIHPVYIEKNTLFVNRHEFIKAQLGLREKNKESIIPLDPIQRVSQATYNISYEIDNGYPCVSLDSTYHLGQCTAFLMDEGNTELCHSSGDSVESCGEYLINNGTEHTFECADVENCTDAENSENYKTVLRNTIESKIEDADGNLPNVRTLTLVVNNNVNSPDL